MDIEELNKFQLILLALLVSFVTSIATGIVTVTLLAQAPPGVTETINHIVERTIQTIVPSATSTPSSTQTVVVKEDDLITGSIASAMQKTGRVFGGAATTSPVVGLAAEIAPGILVTDSAITSKDTLVSIGGVNALFAVSRTLPDIGIAVLSPEATSTVLGAPFTVGDTSAVKLGSTVTAVLGISNERVAIGSVSAVYSLASVSLRAIDTTLDASSITGAPLVNIFGDLVGISTGVSQAAGGKGTFVSASDIIAALAAKPAAATTTSAH
jgi:hypothetical protein